MAKEHKDCFNHASPTLQPLSFVADCVESAGDTRRIALAAEHLLPRHLRRTSTKQVHLERFEIEDVEKVRMAGMIEQVAVGKLSFMRRQFGSKHRIARDNSRPTWAKVLQDRIELLSLSIYQGRNFSKRAGHARCGGHSPVQRGSVH